MLGGVALGLAEVVLRSQLPNSVAGLTDGFVFVLIALLFIARWRASRAEAAGG